MSNARHPDDDPVTLKRCPACGKAPVPEAHMVSNDPTADLKWCYSCPACDTIDATDTALPPAEQWNECVAVHVPNTQSDIEEINDEINGLLEEIAAKKDEADKLRESIQFG